MSARLLTCNANAGLPMRLNAFEAWAWLHTTLPLTGLAAPYQSRPGRPITPVTAFGLCEVLDELERCHFISAHTRERMGRDLEVAAYCTHAEGWLARAGTYWWPRGAIQPRLQAIELILTDLYRASPRQLLRYRQ